MEYRGRIFVVVYVGAIVLTLQVGTRRKKVEGKRQHVSEQRSREEENERTRIEDRGRGKEEKKKKKKCEEVRWKREKC